MALYKALDDLLGFSFLCIFTLLLALDICSTTAVSQSIVETLPGYTGPLPFKLETGYIGLGESDEVQLFYYFVESEGDPITDPLVLWLDGGPGCTGFFGLAYEIGPINFDVEASDPVFVINQYSWTKIANVIFLDSPPGTGFSYATTSKGYENTDTKVMDQVYTFLQQWLMKHPDFIKNPLYISGNSYAGMWVPMVAWRITKGNEDGDEPHMTLQGYSLGNPVTNPDMDANAQMEYAYHLGLISKNYYKMAKIGCKGDYITPNLANSECLSALRHFDECIDKISMQCILKPCYPKLSMPIELKSTHRFLGDESPRIKMAADREAQIHCRDVLYRHSPVWANNLTTQEALHVRKGTVHEWKRCNSIIPYERDVQNVVPYHHLLTNQGYQALVFSGDHDMVVPYIATLEWIHQLNTTVIDNWRPWFVDDQVAGYTEKYMNMNSQYNLTFATVKGAGHISPEDKRKECFTMVRRFLSHNPL